MIQFETAKGKTYGPFGNTDEGMVKDKSWFGTFDI